MTTIHKAARPKKNYDDPTICSMVRRNGHRWVMVLTTVHWR